MASTYREVVFMIKDLLKLNSQESYFEEEHIIYLAHQQRMMLLKQRYNDIRKDIADVNFQTIVLNIAPYTDNKWLKPGSNPILISTSGVNSTNPTEGDGRVPSIINVNSVPSTTTRVRDYATGELLTFVNFDRLHYTGYNKWLSKINYCAISTGQDNGKLIIKAGTVAEDVPDITKVMLTSLFENPLDAYLLQETVDQTNELDYIFPLEAPLIPVLIDMVSKALLGASYRPADDNNNADDSLSDLTAFLRQNLKSPITKAIEDGV